MNIINKIKTLRIKAYIELFRLKPIKKNKVIFWSNNLKSYGCNPKYIAEYLLKNYPDEYDIVWAFNDDVSVPDDLPKEFRTVKFYSLEFLKELHTAKVIITNTRISSALFFKKRKKQYYIQTWHSSLRLKKIEGDAQLPQEYINNAIKDSNNIDLLISGCKFSTNIFKTSFWYNGEILECGTPRNDIIFKNDNLIKEKVKKAMGIDTASKILLFAPTFRNDYSKNDLGLDYTALKNSLEKNLGGNWNIIYRFHPNVVQRSDIAESPQWLKNGNNYNDMQELISATDILITDYSSSMFDAAVSYKPCILFAPDLEDYLANERGLYFDIKSLPFPLALSNRELDLIIANFNKDEYSQKIKTFLDETGSFEDGNASKRICEIIKNVTK